MATATKTAAAPSGATKTFQGQTVPANAVQPALFFKNTRRRTYSEKQGAFSGFGTTQVFELLKSDIIAGATVRFVGSLVITLGGGTCATTWRWPYDLPKLRFTANGQTNLLNAGGSMFRAREYMANPELNSRGVQETVNGAVVQNGTMALASESWGVGMGTSAIAGGTYDVELSWRLPVAEDDKDLTGAIFAQTTAMDLNVAIDWQPQSSLFTLTGAATAVLTGQVFIETEKFSIPVLGDSFVVPDLSVFHSITQSQYTSLQTGDNDIRITGQGVGKSVLRLIARTFNGTPAVPMVVNAPNYGPQGWRYGTNETPELYPDGRSIRFVNERAYGEDVGAVHGFFCHDFAETWAFRDAVDMGQASELRLYSNLTAALTGAPVLEYAQELVFAAGAAA